MKIRDGALDFNSSDDPIAAGAVGKEDGLKDDMLDLVSEGIKPRKHVQKP